MTEQKPRPLSRLRPGQTGRVAALGGGRAFQARLVSMGLLVGSHIRVLRSSGARGATLVASGPMRIGIGRGMAEKILVAVDRREKTDRVDAEARKVEETAKEEETNHEDTKAQG